MRVIQMGNKRYSPPPHIGIGGWLGHVHCGFVIIQRAVGPTCPVLSEYRGWPRSVADVTTEEENLVANLGGGVISFYGSLLLSVSLICKVEYPTLICWPFSRPQCHSAYVNIGSRHIYCDDIHTHSPHNGTFGTIHQHLNSHILHPPLLGNEVRWSCVH